MPFPSKARILTGQGLWYAVAHHWRRLAVSASFLLVIGFWMERNHGTIAQVWARASAQHFFSRCRPGSSGRSPAAPGSGECL